MSVHERVQSLFRIVVSGSALLAIGTIAPVRAAGVSVTNYGHSALLIRGGGQSVMVNPFRAVGCAKGLAEPRVNATVTLASSELPDEGARIGGGTYLVKPGSYRVGGLKIEGWNAQKPISVGAWRRRGVARTISSLSMWLARLGLRR